MTDKWSRRTFIATCALGGPPAAYSTIKMIDYFSILSKEKLPPVRLAADFEAGIGDSAELTAVPTPVHVALGKSSTGVPTATAKAIVVSQKDIA